MYHVQLLHHLFLHTKVVRLASTVQPKRMELSATEAADDQFGDSAEFQEPNDEFQVSFGILTEEVSPFLENLLC